jgi:hypothetical protein
MSIDGARQDRAVAALRTRPPPLWLMEWLARQDAPPLRHDRSSQWDSPILTFGNNSPVAHAARASEATGLTLISHAITWVRVPCRRETSVRRVFHANDKETSMNSRIETAFRYYSRVVHSSWLVDAAS